MVILNGYLIDMIFYCYLIDGYSGYVNSELVWFMNLWLSNPSKQAMMRAG